MPENTSLRSRLERQIRARTGQRIRNLDIELRPECVVLHGSTSTYYVKQLAQHGVKDVLPHVALRNSIRVEEPANVAN